MGTGCGAGARRPRAGLASFALFLEARHRAKASAGEQESSTRGVRTYQAYT